MKFLRNLPKEKLQMLVLVGILTMIIVSGMMVLWINGIREKYAKSVAKIEKLQPQIEEAQRKERAELQNEPLRLEFAAFVRAQRQAMVKGDLFGWVVREISLFSDQQGIQMVSIRPGMRIPHPLLSNYEIYTAQVEVRGQYDELGRFVAAFENRFPTAEIRSLEISAGDSTTTVRPMTMEIGFLIWPETATAWIEPKTTEEPKKKS